MRLIDMALVAGLFMVVGWISAGMWYTRLPMTCPVIQGNTHLAMEVAQDGSYRCVYQPTMWGVVHRYVNR